MSGTEFGHKVEFADRLNVAADSSLTLCRQYRRTLHIKIGVQYISKEDGQSFSGETCNGMWRDGQESTINKQTNRISNHHVRWALRFLPS
jgi:hypothetical protein